MPGDSKGAIVTHTHIDSDVHILVAVRCAAAEGRRVGGVLVLHPEEEAHGAHAWTVVGDGGWKERRSTPACAGCWPTLATTPLDQPSTMIEH